MPKKLTYEQVKDFIENKGYKLLSEEYKGVFNKLEIQCPEGHVFWMKFNNFHQGQRCPECTKKVYGQYCKFSYEQVKNYIEERDHKLLNEEYTNTQTKLQIKCPEGHVFWMTFKHFKRGHRCLECFGDKKFTNQEIIESLEFCENIRENKNGDIKVACANCEKWFTPERKSLLGRIRYVNDESQCEYRMYCSQQCKDECPIFNQVSYPKGFASNEDVLYTTEEYNLWRTTVLEREDYICQYCEEEANIAHHEKPQKTHPHLALDPDNGVACCSDCHNKYGHKAGTECSTGKLASKVCWQTHNKVKQ